MHLLLACNPACSSSGVMRCFNRLATGCCNYFENNMCVISCTSPRVPDVNFDCGKSPCAHYVLSSINLEKVVNLKNGSYIFWYFSAKLDIENKVTKYPH